MSPNLGAGGGQARSTRWRPPDSVRSIGFGAIAFAVGLWWATSSGDPVFQGRVMLAIPYAMGAISLYLITGLAGQISIAQTTMMGLGAFIVFNTAGAPFTGDPRMGNGPAFVVALVGAAVIGMLIAIPALRIRGLHFALVTLAFAYVTDIVLFSEGARYGNDAHQTYVDKPQFLATDHKYITWGLVIIAVMALLMTNLRRSRFGRGLMSLRDSEVAASVVGINVAKYKVVAFMLASVLAAVGGIFYAWNAGNASVTFSSVNVLNGLMLFAFVVICGMRRVSGAVLAGFLFIFAQAIVTEQFSNRHVQLVAGLSVVILVVLLPDGLVTLPGRIGNIIGRVVALRRGTAEPVVAAVNEPAVAATRNGGE